MRNGRSILFCLALFPAAIWAQTPKFLQSPAGQANGVSCQSYALVAALAFKRDPRLSVNTSRELRQEELALRKSIEEKAGSSDVSHAHIVAGFDSYAQNRYVLKKRTHRDIVQMGAAIIEQTGVQSASQVPAEFLLGAAVKDVLLVSVTRVRNDHYPEGHFVTLMGVDGPPTSSRRYLVLNSGVKIKDKWRNTCSEDVPDEPGQYTGQLSWISSEDIQFKSWENGAYMTWRLE